MSSNRRHENPPAVSGKVQGSSPDTTTVDMSGVPVAHAGKRQYLGARVRNTATWKLDWITQRDHFSTPKSIKAFFRKLSTLLKCPVLDYQRFLSHCYSLAKLCFICLTLRLPGTHFQIYRYASLKIHPVIKVIEFCCSSDPACDMCLWTLQLGDLVVIFCYQNGPSWLFF